MEVMTSSPVQECSLMEIDDGNGALNLTKSKRKRRQKDGKRPLNANVGSIETMDADTGIGVSATVDKMQMSTPAGKSSNLKEKEDTEEQDQAEVANGRTGESETADLNVNGEGKRKKRRKLKNKRPTLGGNCKNSDLGDLLTTCESTHEALSTTKVPDVKGGETVSAKAAAPDAEVGNDKIVESETTNLNVNGKEKKKKKAKTKNKRPTLGDILNPQYLQNLEVARGEMDSGTTSTSTSTGNSASQQRKREKMMNNNPDLGKILSTHESTQEGLSTTKVFEVKSGETVLAKTATIDANIVSNGDHAKVSIGETREIETTNLNANGRQKKKKKPKSKNKPPSLAEILNPQYLQNLEAAETGSGTISSDNPASKKHKRQRLNTNSDLGDILRTCESTQEGLRITKVLEVKSGEMVSGKTVTFDANMVTEGDHTEVVNGKKMQENETNNLNVNGKEKKKKKKKKKPKSKNNGTTLGENLNPQYLQNLEAAKHETGSESSAFKSIACPQVADSEMGKKLIILDVNGLLADVLVGRPKGIVADKYLPRRTIFKRPYLDDFLCFCFERFKVGIWSSRTMKNLVPVIDFLLGDLKKKLLFMWDSCKCTNSGIGTLEVKHKNVVVKDLRKIWDENGPKKSWMKGTFHESNTLLVDDSPYKALLNPKHTGIFPASYSYKNRDKDNFLAPKGELQTYLEGLAAADDVQTYVEQHPFGQGAIDEETPHWAFYSSIIERLNDKNIMESLYEKNQSKRKRCYKDFFHAY